MCVVMNEIDKQIESIEKKHKIKLTDREKKNMKKRLCMIVCNHGRCQANYRVTIMQ